MLKVLFSIALVLIQPLYSAAYASDMDKWVSFEKEIKFAAEILVREKGTQYWVMPMPEDTTGVQQAREMIARLQSITHRENPFILPILLAGVKADHQPETTEDDLLAAEIEEALREAGSQRLAFVRCYGHYENVNMPLCLIDYETDGIMQQHLVEAGYLSVSKNQREVPQDIYLQLKAAETEARKAERGLWTPFYFMLRSIKTGH